MIKRGRFRGTATSHQEGEAQHETLCRNVGLDVSVKETAICIVDETLWLGWKSAGLWLGWIYGFVAFLCLCIRALVT